MPTTLSELLARFVLFIPVLLSLSVHEWAHAYAATRLGDDTARLQGRLTLNPLAHIDPVGTLLLPLMGVPFGWAKPVPFNPLRFNTQIPLRVGAAIVAAAGPISNLVILAITGAIYGSLYGAAMFSLDGSAAPLQFFLGELIMVNTVLAVFNMIPIPPLDGSHIADSFMPEKLRPVWNIITANSLLLLLAIIFLPRMYNISLFEGPILLAWKYVIFWAKLTH